MMGVLPQSTARNLYDVTSSYNLQSTTVIPEKKSESSADQLNRQSATTDSNFQSALRDFGLADIERKGDPASTFLVGMYSKLEKGQKLSKAAGHRRVDVAVRKSDTVRGIYAQSNLYPNPNIEIIFFLRT